MTSADQKSGAGVKANSSAGPASKAQLNRPHVFLVQKYHHVGANCGDRRAPARAHVLWESGDPALAQKVAGYMRHNLHATFLGCGSIAEQTDWNFRASLDLVPWHGVNAEARADWMIRGPRYRAAYESLFSGCSKNSTAKYGTTLGRLEVMREELLFPQQWLVEGFVLAEEFARKFSEMVDYVSDAASLLKANDWRAILYIQKAQGCLQESVANHLFIALDTFKKGTWRKLRNVGCYIGNGGGCYAPEELTPPPHLVPEIQKFSSQWERRRAEKKL